MAGVQSQVQYTRVGQPVPGCFYFWSCSSSPSCASRWGPGRSSQVDLPSLPLQSACLFPGADRVAPSSAGSVLFCRVINRWSLLIFQPPERILAAVPSFREQRALCLSSPGQDQPIPKISLLCHYSSRLGLSSQRTAPASSTPGSPSPRSGLAFSQVAAVLQRLGAPWGEGLRPSPPSRCSFKTNSITARVSVLNYIQFPALPGRLRPQIPGGFGRGRPCADSR